jgi:hypothetical protein
MVCIHVGVLSSAAVAVVALVLQGCVTFAQVVPRC